MCIIHNHMQIKLQYSEKYLNSKKYACVSVSIGLPVDWCIDLTVICGYEPADLNVHLYALPFSKYKKVSKRKYGF